MNQKPFAVALAIIISLMGWTIHQAHVLAVEIAAIRAIVPVNLGSDVLALKQMVLDGKEARLAYQTADQKHTSEFEARNDQSHATIETSIQRLVSRPEFETAVAQLKLDIQRLGVSVEEIRLAQQDLRLRMSIVEKKGL